MASAITTSIGYITEVIGELFTMVTTFGTENAVGMGDLFVLGIVCGLALFGIRAIKSLVWGA